MMFCLNNFLWLEDRQENLKKKLHHYTYQAQILENPNYEHFI